MILTESHDDGKLLRFADLTEKFGTRAAAWMLDRSTLTGHNKERVIEAEAVDLLFPEYRAGHCPGGCGDGN